jgi:hypothetical protein
MIEYVAMVHAVTGLSKTDIEWVLPYAQGRQFQNFYMSHHRGDESSALT